MRIFLSGTPLSCSTVLRVGARQWRPTTRCYSHRVTYKTRSTPKKSRSILAEFTPKNITTAAAFGKRNWNSSSTSTTASLRRRHYHAGSNSSSSNKDDVQQYHQHNNAHCAELARMMIPSDANVAGNVHGGTIMQMMEEAAGVAAARYFNQPPIAMPTATSSQQQLQKNQQQRVCALTSRVEQMTFQAPIHVGDVAKVRAQVVFASMHTVAVAVEVKAERMTWYFPNNNNNHSFEETVCNRALVWLVGVVLPAHRISVRQLNPKLYARALAPPFSTPDEKTNPLGYYAYEFAAQAYKARQLRHQSIPGSSFDEDVSFASSRSNNTNFGTSPPSVKKSTTCFTPDYSAVELAQVMLPSDCISDTGLVSGGVVMKLMDNACGVAAVRHCGTNVVTVSVDSVDLVAPVVLGDVLRVRARPTFTSNKSLELQVSVVAERFTTDNSTGIRQELFTTQHAYFSFVSLPLITRNSKEQENSSSSSSTRSKKGTQPSSLPMRPLVLETDDDKAQFELGKKRYEQRQATRQK